MNNAAGNNQPLSERTETLRKLLESELGRPVSYDEAFDTGQALLNFFEVLGAAPVADGAVSNSNEREGALCTTKIKQ